MTTIGEKIYLEQRTRDKNNLGCLEYRRQMEDHEKFSPKTAEQKLLIEESKKKYEEQLKLGYESKRFDFPEYLWKFEQDGKTYYRSSCNNNVYDHSRTSVVVGIWNQETQRIELTEEIYQRIKAIEEEMVKFMANLYPLKK